MKRTLILTFLLAFLCSVPTGGSWAAPDAGVAPATQPAAGPVTPAGAPTPAPTAGENKPSAATPDPGTPAPAPAPGGSQALWQAIVYDVVFGVVVPVAVPVLSVLVFWLLRKIGLKVDLETLDGIAGKAALYAEQKGAEWLKEKGAKPDSVKKEEWAWELVESIDEKLKLREKAKVKLRALILAKIPEATTAVGSAPAPTKPEG